jgi:SAM-dependent methyltransferase
VNEGAARTPRVGDDDPFERDSAHYDAWYDSDEGRDIFRVEVECLAPLVASCASPRLEVGVGTGRFSQALGIELGLDRAMAPLQRARERGVLVVRGDAEHLPVRTSSLGAVVFVMTLCFVAHPEGALDEARRALAPGGDLVIGTVALDSAWGESYARAAREGHPYYRHARLRTTSQLGDTLSRGGWDVVAWRSGLVEAPGARGFVARDGLVAGAGFVALRARVAPGENAPG